MYTKDGETMTVQNAIKDLYVLSKNNGGGSTQTLPLGNVTVAGTQITITYIGSYPTIRCIYGTDKNYGNSGTISGNTCTFFGGSNTTYYYKIIATDDTGIVYENNGNKTTLSGPTAVTKGLPTGVKAIVYLDPTDLGKNCNASNSTAGSGTSGCMKWYAFSENSTSYTMILDHNTKSQVTWNSGNVNTSKKEVQTELNNLVNVTKWKVIPRLIKAQEIANITGNTSWTSAGGNHFYFDSNSTTQTAQSEGASKYYWLFDYTKTCTSFGCKVADSNANNWGYWTDTPVGNSSACVWAVSFNGEFRSHYGAENTYHGIRPVITVSKSNF